MTDAIRMNAKCPFCGVVDDKNRSHNIRRHIQRFHTQSAVLAAPSADGCQFRVLDDKDHPQIVITSKKEGCKTNWGYCFGCHHHILPPKGHVPNWLAVCARHVCKEKQTREKKMPGSSNAAAAPASAKAPRLGDTFERLRREFPVLTDHIEMRENLSVDGELTLRNLLKAVQTRSASGTDGLGNWVDICADLAKDSDYFRGLLRAEEQSKAEEEADRDSDDEDDFVPLNYRAFLVETVSAGKTWQKRLQKETDRLRDATNKQYAAEEELARSNRIKDEEIANLRRAIAELTQTNKSMADEIATLTTPRAE